MLSQEAIDEIMAKFFTQDLVYEDVSHEDTTIPVAADVTEYVLYDGLLTVALGSYDQCVDTANGIANFGLSWTRVGDTFVALDYRIEPVITPLTAL